jgi:hypothetical protein
MKKLLTLLTLLFTLSFYSQEYLNGSIVTQRYDTIENVKIKVVSESRSLNQITYKDALGKEIHLSMEDVKCYTRGDTVFCRIYHTGEMIMVKQLIKGEKLNLYARHYNGRDVYFIEKVYDELIKVPGGNGKFRKVMSEFLEVHPDIAAKIKAGELTDINEIVNLYNAS